MPKFTAVILVELQEDTLKKASEVAKDQILLMEKNAQTNGFARVYGVYDESRKEVYVDLLETESLQEQNERRAAYWKWYDEVNV